MKKIIILGVVIVFSLIGAGEAAACSCLSDVNSPTGKQVKKAYREATAVFYGEVLDVDRQAGVTVKFKIEKSWKGPLRNEVVVRTAENSAMCGYDFEVGKKYLVYADGGADKLGTHLCTRTSASDADAKYLSKIKKPVNLAKKQREKK